MFFASDNWAGAHPDVAAALSEAAGGFDPAYGSGAWDKRVTARFSEIFEREVAVFFVSTGTAANSLSLASVAKVGGVVFCHPEAHIREDECGAPEFLSGGLRLHAVEGARGKMDPALLHEAIGLFPPGFVHGGRPAAVSITQASEIGTVHSLAEIDAIVDVARAHGLPLHMDGARFANALVALGCTPAEMTWRRGIDLLSFGGTKNGCWCAEAVVLFDPSRAGEFAFHHKRAAQLFSKSRFVAAQFEGYFADDLWLHNARHANAMAQRLASMFEGLPTARLAWEPDANEVFPILKKNTADRLKANGAAFYDWRAPHWYEGPIGEDEVLCRFVTSFATREGDIAALFGCLG
ncbi:MULTISPECIES: threonine aldolase family protein [Mesorhizobium]|uniref:L-threonine aldolase n=1 Tax=Mesorhizobium denitrificans TaxID=2294114 RepID=A0A371XDW7_9HYPH|nr:MULTISPECIES: low specificity L-threonine aldolase [Mesorhizobium]RFC67421.1 low specificity L-threonine aldolase [Mesorhizobium denitrificans]